MKQIILPALIALISLSAWPALAQPETNESDSTEMSRRQQQFQDHVTERLNERDRTIALRVANAINQVNQRLTAASLRQLGRMEIILSKITSRADLLTQNNSDTSELIAAAETTNTLINEVRTLVTAQQDTTYVVTINPDQTVGAALRETIHQLRQDHQNLRTELARVRTSIHDLFQILKTLAEDN